MRLSPLRTAARNTLISAIVVISGIFIAVLALGGVYLAASSSIHLPLND